MALSERMLSLQKAMKQYSDTTIMHFRAIHAFGDSVVGQLPAYLGEGAQVMGAPPEGSFRTDGGDYHDAKFSTYYSGTLKLDPIQMGVAIGIPRTQGGLFWARVVIEFEMQGGAISAQVGDGAVVRHIPMIDNEGHASQVCEGIFDYIKSVFENPVAAATALTRGKIGFIQ